MALTSFGVGRWSLVKGRANLPWRQRGQWHRWGDVSSGEGFPAPNPFLYSKSRLWAAAPSYVRAGRLLYQPEQAQSLLCAVTAIGHTTLHSRRNGFPGRAGPQGHDCHGAPGTEAEAQVERAGGQCERPKGWEQEFLDHVYIDLVAVWGFAECCLLNSQYNNNNNYRTASTRVLI